MNPVLISSLSMGAMGLFFGVTLYVASKKLAVAKDPKLEKLIESLPQANCGACGYPGCSGYAKAIFNNEVGITKCAPGGMETVKKIAEIMGLAAENVEPKKAVIRCGTLGTNLNKFDILTYHDCRAAMLINGGPKSCQYACIGIGTCKSVCVFDAISIEDGKIIIDENKCTGCGACVNACPKNLIELKPVSKKIFVACSSRDIGKNVKAVCNIGCIGCKLCEKNCQYDAIHVSDNIAKIDYEKCTNCGKCVEVCPVKCILNK